MSGHGAYVRSATQSSRLFSRLYMMESARLLIPISYESGKASANFTSTVAWSLIMQLSSPPVYRAGLPTVGRISSSFSSIMVMGTAPRGLFRRRGSITEFGGGVKYEEISERSVNGQ